MTHVKDTPKAELKAAPSQKIVIWFDSPFSALTIEENDKKILMQELYKALQERRPINQNNLSNTIIVDTSPRILFISLSDGFTMAQVGMGKGAGIVHALEQAIKKLTILSIEYYRPIWIKLDIVTESNVHHRLDIKKPLDFERSLCGIAFTQDIDIAFLPEQLTTYTLVTNKGLLHKRNISRYISSNPYLTDRFEQLNDLENITLYEFKCESVFFDGQTLTPLYRGHRKTSELSKENILNTVYLAADYLIRSIDYNGRFVYSYFSKKDKADKKYNILRHAGTLYSMLEVYEIRRDDALLKAIQRGLRFLINQMKETTVNGENTLVVVENNDVKLGGNGLSALALAKYIQLTQEIHFLPILQKLGAWIVNTQDTHGKFTIHKQTYNGAVNPDFASDYYPGEALFALSRLYQIDPNPRWLKAAVNGALFLINVRDKDVPDEKLNHDHWLLYALNEIYRLEAHTEILTHAKKITGIIVKRQCTQSPYLDWIGGYNNPPRSTPGATRMEGLCASYQLTNDFGMAEAAHTIFNAIQSGIQFQLQTQFYPESALYLPNPQRAIGGFHNSLTNFEIRIDYVQHNISALLGLYSILGVAS